MITGFQHESKAKIKCHESYHRQSDRGDATTDGHVWTFHRIPLSTYLKLNFYKSRIARVKGEIKSHPFTLRLHPMCSVEGTNGSTRTVAAGPGEGISKSRNSAHARADVGSFYYEFPA
jgi:hypothetical protein